MSCIVNPEPDVVRLARTGRWHLAELDHRRSVQEGKLLCGRTMRQMKGIYNWWSPCDIVVRDWILDLRTWRPTAILPPELELTARNRAQICLNCLGVYLPKTPSWAGGELEEQFSSYPGTAKLVCRECHETMTWDHICEEAE